MWAFIVLGLLRGVRWAGRPRESCQAPTYLCVIWNVRMDRSRIYHGTGEKKKSLLLLYAYYCDSTIINYFFGSPVMWVIPCTGRMNWFSGGGNILGIALGQKPTCCTTMSPHRQPGPEVTLSILFLESTQRSPERWACLKHLVIQITCLKKEALSYLFFKEEISGRLMLLNHLVEKNLSESRTSFTSKLSYLGQSPTSCIHLTI